MPREPWYDSDNPSRVARGAGWRTAVIVLSIVAFFGLLGAAMWALNVATSDVRGRGNAAIKVNDADNRLFQQGNFHQLYNDVIGYDQRLDQAAKDKAAHAGGADASYWDTNYTGLVNQCIATRNDYNAQAQKIVAAKFLDEGLPTSLDPNDPRFDCRESADITPTPGASK